MWEFPRVDSGVVALGFAIVSFIAWLSRLESKTGMNDRDLRRAEAATSESEHVMNDRMKSIEERHQQFDNRVMDKLSKIEQIVANIQGQLSK